MNKKDEVVDELLKRLYSGDGKCIYAQEEINYLSELCKDGFGKPLSLEDVCRSSKNRELIKRELIVESELKDVFDNKRALMPGSLSECNLSATIAKKLGLKNRVALKGARQAVPNGLLSIASKHSLNIEKCRYIFYKDGDYSSVLFHYGSPDLCDAFLVYDGLKINIEYKERMAKAGEYDLSHDENGKLIVPRKVKISHPEVERLVDVFNNDTNLFDEIGHNYNDFSDEAKITCIAGYFNSKDIDVLVSIDANDEIVAIIPKWIDFILDKDEGAFQVISADGSEIRTTGRNPCGIICPDHFKRVFVENGGIIAKTGDCSISSGSDILRIANGRGMGRPSKLKICSIYEVPLNNKGYGLAREKDGKWSFNISSVRQKRPTVSPHISIIASRSEIIDKLDVLHDVAINIEESSKKDSATEEIWSDEDDSDGAIKRGTKVYSGEFGAGRIIAIKSGFVWISFKGGAKPFRFPSDFENGKISGVDSSIRS